MAFACWLLLAFSWQTGVVAGHYHPPAREGAGAVRTGVRPDAQLTAPRPAKSPIPCMLCRELAHAGQLLLPGAATLAAPVSARLAPAAMRLRAGIGPQRSHAWQSRGPPAPR